MFTIYTTTDFKVQYAKKLYRFFSFLWMIFLCWSFLMTQKVQAQTVSFGVSQLANNNLNNPTSLQFGPDGRLYVSQQKGEIKVFTIQRNAANDYSIIATETILSIKQIPNRDDDGTLNPSENSRLVTGLLVKGTAANPIIYVCSSDPRIGAGPSGEDLHLDTNSGILSKLEWDGLQWVKTDLVRGLPRSEENHASNGLQLDETNNILYIAQGGNTNMGGISNNFALRPEYALSACVLSVNLNAITNPPYDLPTLDDEDKTNVSTTPGYVDEHDPFGGNDGKNQAMIDPTGPVQVYGTGFRNPYDVLLTQSGQLYTFDNGPNGGWGGPPVGGTCLNAVSEPGTTYPDNLHLITGQGYYGGHPNLVRANRANTFNTTNPQSPVPLGFENPVECDYRIPGVEDGALTTILASSNGLAEYTATNFVGAMQRNLIVAAFNGKIYRIVLNAAGDAVVPGGVTELFTGFGGTPLDVVCQGDFQIFPGTIWSANVFGTNKITIFEPADYDGGGGFCDPQALDPALDEDMDNYTNGDETANGTDPCSAGSKPSDFDGDFISDLLDPDDDNDATPDILDAFAVDALNGTGTNLPIFYSWENDGSDPGGLLNLGFTGLMSNGVDDYIHLYDVDNMTVGGAAGVVTVDSIPAGNALGAANTQEYGFQFGVNVASQTFPFFARTRVAAPFAGFMPQSGQSMGLFIGTGFQSDYLKIVLEGNGGAGGIQVLLEEADSPAPFPISQIYNAPILGTGFVDLYLVVNPTTFTVQPAYSIDGGLRTNLGAAISIPASWLSSPLATGVIGSAGSAGQEFPVTWDFMEVMNDPLSSTGDWNEVLCNNHPSCSSQATPRHENAFVQSGDKFYLIGGRGLKPVEVYNPATNVWTTGATPPIELHHFQAVDYNGLIYVLGAFTGAFPNEVPVSNVYIYNPLANNWTVGPTIPINRRRGAAGCVVYNEQLYMVGGLQNGHSGGWVPWVDKFDPRTNTFTQLADAPRARDHFQAAVLNDKIYAVGGRRTGEVSVFEPTVPEVDVYNIVANTWTTLPVGANLPTERAGASVAVQGQELLLIGGESASQTAAHNETEALNVLAETWRTLDAMDNGRHSTQAITSNGGVYTVAGAGQQGQTPELNSVEAFYLFSPTAPDGDPLTQSSLTAAPTLLDFGQIPPNSGATQTITLDNTSGNQAILLSNIVIDNTLDFSHNVTSPFPLVIQSGERFNFDVTFVPSDTTGQKNGVLTVLHTGSNSPLNIVLTGGTDTTTVAIYRVNANGLVPYTTAGGDEYQEDGFFNVVFGNTSLTTKPIAGTLDDVLYQSERAGNFSYNFPVLNGEYEVLLHFAEIWSGANGPGLRVFDVNIEGTPALDNYDIFSDVGFETAVVKSFDIVVNDGMIDIDFLPVINFAKVSAIEILTKNGGAPPINTPPTFTISSDLFFTQDFSETAYVLVTPDPIPPLDAGQTVTYSLSPPSVYFADVSIEPTTGLVTVNSIAGTTGSQIFTITADDGQTQNNIATQDFGLNVVAPNDTVGVYRVNSNGPLPYTTVNGDDFSTDDFFNMIFGNTSLTLNPIAGTQDDALYQSERAGNFSYDFPVTNGDYTVKLHFAEIWAGAMTPGVRVFDVDIEGVNALDNYDIFADVGFETAAIKTFNTTVTDGVLNIQFTPVANFAKISAIEILSLPIFNAPPTFATSGDVNVNEDFGGSQSVTVTPVPPPASEVGQTVTYSLLPATSPFANVAINSANGTVTINSIPDGNGTQVFSIIADDAQGANNIAIETFTLNVQAVNDMPTFANSGSITVDENFATTESVFVTPDPVPLDEAGQTVTYSLLPASVPFANVSIDPITGQVTITAVQNGNGTQLFTIQADDGQAANNIATSTFNLTVNPVNTAPTFVMSGDAFLEENFSSVVFIFPVPDPVPADETGQTVTYTMSPLSVTFADVSIDPNTGTVTINSILNENGSQIFTVTADDGQGVNNTATATFTVSVDPINSPPLFTTSGDVTVNENFVTTESVIVTPDPVPSDETGQMVLYSLSPPSVTFANVSINVNTGEVTITSVVDGVGSQVFTITADDGQAQNNTAMEMFTLTVNDTGGTNTPPTFTTSGNVTVDEDFATTQTVTVTPDPVPPAEQGQIVTYSLTPPSIAFANVAINSSTGEVSITATPNGNGIQEFIITANDGQAANNIATQTFTLSISAVNDAPTFVASGDIIVDKNFASTELVFVTPDVVPSDESTQNVVYSLSPASVPFANVVMDSNTGTVTITSVLEGVGSQVFTITANDGQAQNNTATDTFILTVTDPGGANTPPTFTTSGNVTIDEDFVNTQTVTVTPDPVPPAEQGQTVTYSLSPATVPFADVSINSSTGEVAINAVLDQNGTQLFTITANDGQAANNIATQDFTLTIVAVNDQPVFVTDGNIMVEQDFTTTEVINAIPRPVPSDEAAQVVTYSLSPATVPFANVAFNPSTGKTTVTSIAGASGTQIFTVTADDGQAVNNTYEQSFTLIVSPSGGTQDTVFRINANGRNYTDLSGDLFIQDDFFTASFSNTSLTNNPIANTTDDALYQSERAGSFSYNFPVIPGNYEVKLHFAEIWTGANGAGLRVFDVEVDDQVILNDYDIFAEVGFETAVIKTFNVTAIDNVLNVDFVPVVNFPKISAIEITSLDDNGLDYKVNSNGPDFTTTANGHFCTDNFFIANFGNTSLTISPIANTVDDILFQSERAGSFSYDFPMLNGTYDVKLYFAEIWSGAMAAGVRVFDVVIEDNLVLDDYDIYAEVGFETAVIKTYTVTMTDGTMNIDFIPESNYAKISAIEIVPSTTITTSPLTVDITQPSDGDIFQTPTNITIEAVVTGAGGGEPDHLRVTNPNGGGWRKLRLGYDNNNLWNPKQDVIAGGNTHLEITLRDFDGNADWSKLKIQPQGNSGSINLESYVLAAGGVGDAWTKLVIPLSDFSGIDFTQISYIETPFSANAAFFDIGISEIKFTGGTSEFLWFGEGKTDNIHDGTGSGNTKLMAVLVPASGSGSGSGPGVQKVAFYEGANLLGEDTSAPYAYTWNNVPAGNYILSAVVTDTDGLTNTSTFKGITVEAPALPPTIELVLPSNGDTLVAPAEIIFAANASSNNVGGSIERVEFYEGANFIVEDLWAPYNRTWSNVPPGTYVLTAVAFDANGLNATSNSVTVVVNEPPGLSPLTVALTSPLEGDTFVTPTDIDLTADVAGAAGEPAHFRITNPNGSGWRKLRIGYHHANLWNPKQDVIAGGNTHIEITLRDFNGGAEWNKMKIRPQGNGNDPVGFESYVAAVGGIGDAWTKISIPLADFSPTINFTQLSYLELPFSTNAAFFDIGISEIKFTGGTSEFLWFGEGKTDNAHDGNGTGGGNLTATIIPAGGSGGVGVDHVEFYEGANFIGEDVTEPYSFLWTSVPEGTYSVTAKVIDDNNDESYSVPVNITVAAQGSNKTGEQLKDVVANGMSLSPNPTQSTVKVTLENETLEGELLIEVFDLEGKLYQTETVTKLSGVFEHLINLEKLAPGMYLIQLSQGNDFKVAEKVFKLD